MDRGFDLSNFLGIPAQFYHSRIHRRLDRVVIPCERPARPNSAGYFGRSIPLEEVWKCCRRRLRAIAYGGDLWLYRRALAEGIEGLRTSVWRR